MEITYFIHPLTGERKVVLTPGDVDATPALLRAIDVSIARWHWSHNVITPFRIKSIYIRLESHVVISPESYETFTHYERLSSVVQLNQREALQPSDVALGQELDAILLEFISVGVHHGNA